MARKQEITFVNYIILDGQRIPMDDLNEEQQELIAIRLNDQAMKALGYVRVEETA